MRVDAGDESAARLDSIGQCLYLMPLVGKREPSCALRSRSALVADSAPLSITAQERRNGEKNVTVVQNP